MMWKILFFFFERSVLAGNGQNGPNVQLSKRTSIMELLKVQDVFLKYLYVFSCFLAMIGWFLILIFPMMGWFIYPQKKSKNYQTYEALSTGTTFSDAIFVVLPCFATKNVPGTSDLNAELEDLPQIITTAAAPKISVSR